MAKLVGTHVTLRLSTRDQLEMTELMRFWNRTDKGIMKLAFDQLVLATKQLRERLEHEKLSETNTYGDAASSDDSGTTGMERETSSATDRTSTATVD